MGEMATILESWKDIAGNDYSDFLDMALDWFGFFSLVRRDGASFDGSGVQVWRDLDRHETNRRRASHWAGTRVSSKTAVATIISYRLDSGSRSVLARPGSLFAWVAPAFPEDIAFYQRDGRLAFATCTHEGMAWAIDLDFGYRLPKHLEFSVVQMKLSGEGRFEYVA